MHRIIIAFLWRNSWNKKSWETLNDFGFNLYAKKRINMHTHEYEYLFGIIFMCNSNICIYDIYNFYRKRVSWVIWCNVSSKYVRKYLVLEWSWWCMVMVMKWCSGMEWIFLLIELLFFLWLYFQNIFLFFFIFFRHVWFTKGSNEFCFNKPTNWVQTTSHHHHKTALFSSILFGKWAPIFLCSMYIHYFVSLHHLIITKAKNKSIDFFPSAFIFSWKELKFRDSRVKRIFIKKNRKYILFIVSMYRFNYQEWFKDLPLKSIRPSPSTSTSLIMSSISSSLKSSPRQWSTARKSEALMYPRLCLSKI